MSAGASSTSTVEVVRRAERLDRGDARLGGGIGDLARGRPGACPALLRLRRRCGGQREPEHAARAASSARSDAFLVPSASRITLPPPNITVSPVSWLRCLACIAASPAPQVRSSASSRRRCRGAASGARRLRLRERASARRDLAARPQRHRGRRPWSPASAADRFASTRLASSSRRAVARSTRNERVPRSTAWHAIRTEPAAPQRAERSWHRVRAAPARRTAPGRGSTGGRRRSVRTQRPVRLDVADDVA